MHIPQAEKENSDEEEDFYFPESRSSSQLTSDRGDQPISDRSGSDSVERLLTEQEIAELDKRLEDVLDRLKQQRDDYEKWEDDLNARRLKVFGRLKVLNSCHRKRLEMYETVKGYIQGKKPTAPTCDKEKINTWKHFQRKLDKFVFVFLDWVTNTWL